jgi:glycosyltransferase involved in cell wall biosynthesis
MGSIPSKWAHKALLFPVNGISSNDLALTTPTDNDHPGFQVISAGTLIRVKGFGLAIKCFKRFVDKYPDADLTIVGSGPEEPRLRELVRRSNLQSKVQFLPAIPRDELLRKLRSQDVFLFPSLRDGGAAVVIEAMAAGKPVVCLDTGGPDMHVTEQCGVKIPAVSPQQAVRDLADALERLYLDQGLRLKQGRAARQRAQEVYHWDRLGERLMEIYRRALPAERGV